ncbi:MAG TPA: hypothetical protein VGW35_14945 [Methylomirabilota bacterium]|nr:hypothetical protein [Methylomirabilota bacterium]
MRPGGHLATAVALGAGGYAATGSAELAAGCVAGAFLIDVDHYLDYLFVEGQWRHPGPSAFLRYYFTHRYRRVVLPLHSLELLGLLTALAVAWPRPGLHGYVAGALLHLVLDIIVNGELLLRRPVLTYCFVYRARLGFVAARLSVPFIVPPDAGRAPLREFFTWRLPEKPVEAVSDAAREEGHTVRGVLGVHPAAR